jgi:hypothetical protein
MKTAGIVAALAATFNSALADVLCHPETLHYKPRMVSAAEREGFANTIDEICSSTTENFVQEQFESTVFSLTRTTEDTVDEDECKATLNSVIEACIAGKNTGGGSFATNSLTVEIRVDSSKTQARGLFSNKNKEKSKDKSKGTIEGTDKDTTPGLKNGDKKNDKQLEGKLPGNKNPKSQTPDKPPVGKTCKPRKGKGQNNKGKKTPAKVVRHLISKLLGRSGSETSDYGDECNDQPMTAGGAWGEDTYRGYRFMYADTMSTATLREVANEAYQEVKAKRRMGDKFVVAALFVPHQGVFIGTVPHGLGLSKVQSFAPVNAPELWEILKNRRSDTASLYHAEDMAMLHAIESKAVNGNGKFPTGSRIAAWGKVGSMPRDRHMNPCSTFSSISPNCKTTVQMMGIAE